MTTYRYIGENLQSMPYLRKEHFYVNGIEITKLKVANEVQIWFAQCLKEGAVETITVFQYPRDNPNFKDIVHFIHRDIPKKLMKKIQKETRLKREGDSDVEKVYSKRF